MGTGRTMRTRTAGLVEGVAEAIGMMDLGAGDLKEVVKRTNR